MTPDDLPRQWLREPTPLIDKRGWLERQLDTPAMDRLLIGFAILVALSLLALVTM